VFTPPLGITSEDGISEDQRYRMQQYMIAAAMIEPPAQKPSADDTATGTHADSGTGKRAIGEEGKMGSTTSKNTDGRFGIAGPA
ncbi:hypothetical protein, partial [Rhizobium leguminosarum]|uniref:hypothetical protein n=1 Tax=Rhizobium leguminosarum TaxID=384 RepID=UPI003F961ABE